MSDEREEIIVKFMKKYEVAFPEREPMTHEEVAAYVDEMIQKGRHVTFPMVGEKESWRCEMEERIHPESGKKMTRCVRPVTFTYRGYSETIEMPGWFTDDEDGVFSSEDLKHCEKFYTNVMSWIEKEYGLPLLGSELEKWLAEDPENEEILAAYKRFSKSRTV